MAEAEVQELVRVQVWVQEQEQVWVQVWVQVRKLVVVY